MDADHLGGAPLCLELDRLVQYDDAAVIAEMQRAVRELPPSAPVTRAGFDRVARVSSSTCVRRFGGWREALEAAGFGDRYGGRAVSAKMRDQRARELTNEEILAELRRVADVVGSATLTRAALLAQASPMTRNTPRRFASAWSTLSLFTMGRPVNSYAYSKRTLPSIEHPGRRVAQRLRSRPTMRSRHAVALFR